MIFSLAPNPPLSYLPQSISIFPAMGVGEKFLLQIKWSEIKMLPQHVPCLVALKEIGPLAALTETPQFRKTTRAQFDCIQFCDNKAGCLNESETRFSYVRELEECRSVSPSHFHLLLRVSFSIHCLPLWKKSLTLCFLFYLTLSHPCSRISFVLDLGSLRLSQCILSACLKWKLCVKIESQPAALFEAVALVS